MIVKVTPWARTILGDAYLAELRKGPDELALHLGKGADGWTVRLWRLVDGRPSDLLVELFGQSSALAAVDAAVAAGKAAA